ncbi:MAG: hypothetical protein SGI89_14125, partial [bacterium]|nr:hypothetical protein [bacterium]
RKTLSILYSKCERCTASVRRGFCKTSAHLFLNCVPNGKGGVWGGIFHLLLFLFWGNLGRTKIQIQNKNIVSVISLWFRPV